MTPTHEQILAMDERELDYHVYMLIMGGEEKTIGACADAFGKLVSAGDPAWPAAYAHAFKVPYYSSEMNRAWAVVERFRRNPAFDWFNFTLWPCATADGKREFMADFAGGNCPGRATGETAPLAICRAALWFVTEKG